MRSLVGAARDDDFDDDDAPPPPKKRAKAKGKPKINRSGSKRGRGNDRLVSRWASSLKSTAMRMALWSVVLVVFFLSVVVAGLFSGGHVSAAIASAKQKADQMMASAGFTVQTVTLEGHTKTAPKEVGRMLGIKAGDLMLYVDVDEARARLEALPWVKNAEVKRVWPNRIVVHITERRPVALWQIDGAIAVIDAMGKPISGQDPARFAGLPLVVGKGAETSVGALLALIDTQPNLKSRVKAAVRVGERRWNLRLANGVEVRLPEEGAEAALAELIRLEREENVLARDIKAIDLRFPDRFIVKLPPGSPLITPAPRAGGRET
jgi:cell division protein FtsQ